MSAPRERRCKGETVNRTFSSTSEAYQPRKEQRGDRDNEEREVRVREEEETAPSLYLSCNFIPTDRTDKAIRSGLPRPLSHRPDIPDGDTLDVKRIYTTEYEN